MRTPWGPSTPLALGPCRASPWHTWGPRKPSAGSAQEACPVIWEHTDCTLLSEEDTRHGGSTDLPPTLNRGDYHCTCFRCNRSPCCGSAAAELWICSQPWRKTLGHRGTAGGWAHNGAARQHLTSSGNACGWLFPVREGRSPLPPSLLEHPRDGQEPLGKKGWGYNGVVRGRGAEAPWPAAGSLPQHGRREKPADTACEHSGGPRRPRASAAVWLTHMISLGTSFIHTQLQDGHLRCIAV